MQICRLLLAAGVEAVSPYQQISGSRLPELCRQRVQYRRYGQYRRYR